jgi:phosphoglycolate phosphatase
VKVNREIPIRQLRLLIFDLDGTLVDSRQDLGNSVNAMLRHFGRHEVPLEVISSYIGDGAPMLVRRALGDPKDEHFVHIALQFFLDYYRKHKLDHTYVYDGVIDALKALSDALPRKMAVLSNKPVGPSRAIVDALGMNEFFFQIYGGNSFETKKPDPFGVRMLLREANCEASEAVIIGDSDVDVVTAQNAGIYSVGCSYGLAPHTLESAPPDVLVDNPREWIDLFNRVSTPRPNRNAPSQ